MICGLVFWKARVKKPPFRDKTCIISSGKGNHFGFPHPQTLERLKAIGCRLIRIDRKGAVEIRISTKGMGIKTYLD